MLPAPDSESPSARMMMADACHSVTMPHSGLARHYLSSTSAMAIASLMASDRSSLGMGAPRGPEIPLDGLGTGGLALPLLLALPSSGWTIARAVQAIGQGEKHVDRNWLRRLPAAARAAAVDHEACLRVEAGDTLRRAVDHYHAMDGIGMEVKAAEAAPFTTCEEALNHTKAVTRFIRHGDKVRNYTLPVLDPLVFYLEEYRELARIWTAWEHKLALALHAWFAGHPLLSCAPGGGHRDVCYGLQVPPPARAGNFLPHQRHAEARAEAPPAAPAPAATACATVEIDLLLEGMQRARESIIAAMRQADGATWNYGTERPATVPPQDSTPAALHMHRIRLDAMLDDVWKQVDRPGYFGHGTHRIARWRERHATSERATAVTGDLAAVRSVFLPDAPGGNPCAALGRAILSSTGTGAVLAGEKDMPSPLRHAGELPIRSGLLDHGQIHAYASAEVKAAGAGMQNLLPRLMQHFGQAAAALAALGDAPPAIQSCNDAMALCTKASEIVVQMEITGRYAAPCIGMVDMLVAQCLDWTRKEEAMWRHMEMRVGEWLRDDEVHQSCWHDNRKCYGARHRRVGASLLGRGGSWMPVTNDPHHPIG